LRRRSADDIKSNNVISLWGFDMQKLGTVIGAAVALALSCSAAQSAELILNGNFDSDLLGGAASSWTPGNMVGVGSGNLYNPCCGTSGSPGNMSNQFAAFGWGNLTGVHSISQLLSTVSNAN